MAQLLSLAESHAKIDRAEAHVASLDAEIWRVSQNADRYLPVGPPIDEDSGICSVYLAAPEVHEPGLATLAGDIYHNLRSSYDYIVTALAKASGTDLRTRHQFPIFGSREDYLKNVRGEDGVPRPSGCLQGITVGLDEVQRIQPFNMKHRDGPTSDTLWLLNRFCNADKHRNIALFAAELHEARVQYVGGGTLLEYISVPQVSATWEPTQHYEVTRLRFARPYPDRAEMHIKVEYRGGLYFATPPFGDDPLWRGHSARFFETMCTHARNTVERFEKL